ncbi:tetratricopeptide repeat protein 24 [Lampris incognitus]|uniref:tetratricopeptide repeat protein 24 n=1 Tax=Lampris incognitus TaxID=2546036 RepID=UPI0024B50392|nr:tetratricopeptide repeat protein 24 [Lampris incognitus]
MAFDKGSRGWKSMAQGVKRRSRESEPTELQTSVEELTASGHFSLQSARWEEALICLKKALRAATELQDRRVRRACSFNLGAAYIEMGRPEKGLDFLKQARLWERGERVADLQFNLAVAHQALGRNADAAGYFLQAAQLYRSQGDGDSEGDTCVKMAQCYIQLRDWGQAVRSFLRGGESYKIAGRSDAAAIAHKEAASCMIQSEQFSVDDIISVLAECQVLSDSITDKHTLGELYLSLGLCYSQLRYFQEAVGCYQLGLSQKDSPPAHRAALLQNLGAALNSLGRYHQALDYHRQAAGLHGSLRNRGSQARCFSNLALACRELKNNQEAAENFLHALQAFRDTGDHPGQRQVCEALGETYFTLRELHKSIQYYKQALAALPPCQDWCVSVQERLVNKLTTALQQQLYLSLTGGLQWGCSSETLLEPNPKEVQQRWNRLDTEPSLAQDPENQPTGRADGSRATRHFRKWTSRFCTVM